MNDSYNSVDNFFEKYKIVKINREEMLGAFIDEMKSGLSGCDSSLAMIPSYIGTENKIPVDKPVIVLDAGGTNLRVCTVTFDNHGKEHIRDFNKFQMPGIEKELSADEFYSTICDYLEPVIDKSDLIGFCFSYPSEISSERDGRLIHWTKEVKVPEVTGKYIGAGLKKALEDRGYSNKNITLLNDTVSSLLAGKVIGEQRECEGYIGFILGTGTNTAYVESNCNISKVIANSGSQIINVESGNFNKLAETILDNRYDKTTDNPGKQRFEKMISGRYLGDIAYVTIQQAADDALFSDRGRNYIKSIEVLETSDLSFFLENPFSKLSRLISDDLSKNDREVLYYIISGLIERAAELTAVNIAAAVIKSDTGRSPLHPVCINVDGSTFHKLHGFRAKAEAYLRDILTPKGFYFETYEIENAPIIGSAIAGLIG